jgi:hypothetical protein
VDRTGSVNLAIMGVNVPGLNDALDSDAVLAAQRRSRLGERGITNFVSNAAKCMLTLVLFRAVTDLILQPYRMPSPASIQ